MYELWPVLVGLKRWGFKYKNKKINIVIDNMQVLAMVNTGRSKNKLCMDWLRELFWTCFVFNIELHATYIKSKDDLSRLPYKGVVDRCTKNLVIYGMSHSLCYSPARDLEGCAVDSG